VTVSVTPKTVISLTVGIYGYVYSVTTMCDLFNVVNPRAIVDFTKEIGLYRKL
jgi:hypothetical protein